MIFLGQASNYSVSQVLRHLFAFGHEIDSDQLKQALQTKYGQGSNATDIDTKVALYQTGRSALTAALIATTPKHSAVVIPGLTCIAVVRAVRTAGCIPVFVDIDPKTLQYDFDQLEETLRNNSEIRTIIVQNTLGFTIDMQQLEKITKAHKVKLVEDLAHSAGRFYPDGREVGTVGAATALSFGKGKAIDTISGGAVVIREEKTRLMRLPCLKARKSTRWRARWYPMLGLIIRAGYHVGLGKIFTGVFLKLHWIERSADAELNLDHRLSHWQAKLALKQLQNLPKTPLREYALVKQREKLLADWRRKGYLLDEIWYDTPVSPIRYRKEANFPTNACPNTVKIATEIVNLPTWYSEKRLAPVRAMMQKYLLEEENAKV